MTGSVLVFGSANADMVYLVDHIPEPGETVHSRGVSVHPGGKGLNQAVAASLAGVPTALIAAIGEDQAAETIRVAAAAASVDITLVRRVSAPTGLAVIALDDSGENTIVVQNGANGLLTQLHAGDISAIRAATVVLAQLEVPIEVVLDVARTANAAGRIFVLNPSPMRELPAELLALVDVLVVNEHEARQVDAGSLGLPCVITTLGAAGAEVRISGTAPIRIPARVAAVLDATGAGDTFVGVLAAEIAAGRDLKDAAYRATVASSLAVERMGAVASIPTKEEVDIASNLLTPHEEESNMPHDVRDARELVPAEAEQLQSSGHHIGDRLDRARDAARSSDLGALREIASELEKAELEPGWEYVEPDDESAVLALAAKLPEFQVAADQLESRVTGAWLGRCVGNTMGKPLEGLPAEVVRTYLTAAGDWPQTGYVPLISPLPAGVPHLHPSADRASSGSFEDVPRDDDIDWTILGLLMVEEHGAALTTDAIADFWLDRIPFTQTYTAERAAYRNLVRGLPSSSAATVDNPYREWIGALIRADIFGYVYPGRPAKAAQAALVDARLSHVKNGLYGEIWAAALVSTAFATDSARVALEVALDAIPEGSRLAEALREVLRLHASGAEVEAAYDLVDSKLGHYHWVHTINNAALIAIGLLWGDDYPSSVALTIAGGRDTDSTAATVGSVFGALHGAEAIPADLVGTTHVLVRSSVRDFDRIPIAELAARTMHQIGELS
jgi:ribokinase